MSRSCRNTRENKSMAAAALKREATANGRIEWTGNIKVYYPATVAK